MGRPSKDTTPADLVAAYEAIVALGDAAALSHHTARMRADYQHRTGAFGPEDPWFEARARAFWDDALTTQRFATLAARELDEGARAFAACAACAHRGLFLVEEVDDRGATLLDLWSGAELVIRYLDDSQALALDHAEGAFDARVTSSPCGTELYLLPGAYHHGADALEPAMTVLVAARARGLSTGHVLDALMRMDLVLRSSSRVKAAFAYRIEGLDARPGAPPKLG